MSHKHKIWINKLALEADNAVTLQPPRKQDYSRHQIAGNITKLQNQQNPYRGQAFGREKEELRLLNHIKDKLHKNRCLVTKADKGNWAVIIDRNVYKQKVENFASNNEAIEVNGNITDKFQKYLRITINECKQLISAYSKWRYINVNACTPVI